MRVVAPDNTFITPIDKRGNIQNVQLCIYAKSGYNKGLVGEGLVEWFHKKGYLIIIAQDPKDELEYAYQMFPPRKDYHKEHLNLISQYVGKWKLPSRKDVKLYHPFSSDIPTNHKLPEMNIFTIPLKSLGRAEWGLLSEVHGENETVSVLLKASEEINDEDGIYSFAHYVQDSVKGKLQGRTKKSDWKNFGLESSSGTMKEVMKVSNILRPFKRHPFLSKENCEYNLDWKNILQDQKNYHVFVSNYIGRKNEEKVVDFLTLYIFENLIKNKKYLKHPVLVVVPEISITCPFRPVGHKEFLANSIKSNLKTIRSEGRGMSSLLDTQVFNDVDEDVRGSSTIQLYGELGDIKDIENVCKALGWGRPIKEQLNKAEVPKTYLVRGVEEGSVDDGGYLFFYPSAMHCEPEYNFEEMYKEHHRIEPERYPLISYGELSEKIKKYVKEDEMKVRKKVKKKEEQEKLEEERRRKSKEEKQKESEEQESKEEKVKEIQDKNKETLMRLCYERYNDESLDKKEKTYRKIAEKLGIKSHKTVKKYIEDYERKLESGNSMDYEERFEKMQEENKDLD